MTAFTNSPRNSSNRLKTYRLPQMQRRRREMVDQYHEAFSRLDALELPVERPHVESAWHLYPIRLRLDRLSIDRGRFMEELRRRQIGASVHFIPLHQQPFYSRRYGYRTNSFPVAEQEYPRLVSLPIYSRMNDEDVHSVVTAVAEIAQEFRA